MRSSCRQEKIGLATPGTSRRFVLWAVVGAAAFAMLSCLLVLALVGARLVDVPVALIGLALGIVVANAAGYVSFFWPSLLARRASAEDSLS